MVKWTLLALLLMASAANSESVVTRSGYYVVEARSTLAPIPINRMHPWIIRLTDPDGTPVKGAQIELTGGMPEHNHGLPTVPRMTAELENGEYRIDGIRFHMRGEWVLNLTINVQGRRDTVAISLTL